LLTKAKKIEIVKNLKEKLLNSQGIFVTSFNGFTVAESNEIRKLIREKGGEFKVIKNTLIKIASQETPVQIINEYVEGPTALIIAYQDPVEVAKVLNNFIKTHPSLKLRGFIIQGKGFKAEAIEDLVKLPPKHVLIAQLLGTFQAPIANFIGVLSGIIRNFLYVLKAIQDKKSKEK